LEEVLSTMLIVAIRTVKKQRVVTITYSSASNLAKEPRAMRRDMLCLVFLLAPEVGKELMA
jgi:hypothetical protein